MSRCKFERRSLPGKLRADLACLTLENSAFCLFRDSALLAALIFERGLDALGDTTVEVAAADPNARLNILAANGSQLRATTWGDTLSVLRRDDGMVLASEPYDDNPGWQEIPDRHLVAVEGSRVDLIPLKGSP